MTSDPKLAIVRELGQTTEMQWVGGIPMTGQLALLALDNGLKLGNQWQPWWINPALSPEPSIWITDGEQPASSHRVDESQGTNVFAANDGNVYAVLETASGHQIACSAVGRGAQIDVACPNSAGGTLSVQEQALKGWEIFLDGQDANLDTNAGWIAVDLPQDVQQISFRFHSPYLRTSILLLIVGILWGAWWLIAPGWHPISTVSRKLKTA